MIDTHVHMDSLERAALEIMALSGIKAVVADGSPMPGLSPSPETVFDFYERTIGYDSERGSEFFIEVFVMVGINMFFVPSDFKRVLRALPEYLMRDRVVGIGEIGLEPRSETCPDLEKQKEIVTECLSMAKEYDKTVLLHLPSMNRMKWLDEYLLLIDKIKLDRSKIIISHADSSCINSIIEMNCIAGITVQPWRNITPKDVVKILKDTELDNVLVDSDSSLRYGSDPLGVPKTALEMKMQGFSEKEIKKIFYENPIKIFKL